MKFKKEDKTLLSFICMASLTYQQAEIKKGCLINYFSIHCKYNVSGTYISRAVYTSQVHNTLYGFCVYFCSNICQIKTSLIILGLGILCVSFGRFVKKQTFIIDA
jgi:hypothetical protein